VIRIFTKELQNVEVEYGFSKEFLASAGIRPDDTLTAEVQEGKIILTRAFPHRTLRQRAAASWSFLR